jgi:hypothetical protein
VGELGNEWLDKYLQLKGRMTHQATKLALSTGSGIQFDTPITSTAFEAGDFGLFHEVIPTVLSGAIRNLTESNKEASTTKRVHHVHGV